MATVETPRNARPERSQQRSVEQGEANTGETGTKYPEMNAARQDVMECGCGREGTDQNISVSCAYHQEIINIMLKATVQLEEDIKTLTRDLNISFDKQMELDRARRKVNDMCQLLLEFEEEEETLVKFDEIWHVFYETQRVKLETETNSLVEYGLSLSANWNEFADKFRTSFPEVNLPDLEFPLLL